MREVLQFVSVPVSVICLMIMLAVVGGIENGTMSITTGLLASGVVLVLEYGIFRAHSKKRGEDHE